MVDASSVLMALAELRELWDEGVLVLEVSHEVGELALFHAVLAGIELVMCGGEDVGDVVELCKELVALLIKSMVLIHFSDSSRVVKALNFFDEHAITFIMGGEEGEEPGSCSLCRGLSIVRIEEELNDVCRFPRLLPCQ